MASLAIIGPGAVGCVLAARLQHAGQRDVVLCARRALDAVRVRLPETELTLAAPFVTAPAMARPADWVLVTTKAYDCAGAASWFPGVVGSGTRVAILQNGVEHRERFAAYLPPERILPVMVDLPAERPESGQVVQRGAGRMVVPAGPDGDAFVQLLAGTGIAVTTTPDFRTAVWRKLTLNAVGAINALLLQPAGVFRDEAVGKLALEMARECVAVGRAEGAVLGDSLPDEVLAASRAAPPDAVNSLHADRAAGRRMEVDARNGAVVRFGRKHGIATPRNEMATALLSALQP